MHCGFCENKENDERVIIENDLAKAFLTTQPIVPGHTLIIPKRCIQNFADLTDNEIKSLFDLMKELKVILKKTFDCKGFNHSWNEGKIAGQEIPHFHLHIVPRKEGDKGIYEYEPRKFLYRPGSRADSPEEELLKVVEMIRKNLK